MKKLKGTVKNIYDVFCQSANQSANRVQINLKNVTSEKGKFE